VIVDFTISFTYRVYDFTVGCVMDFYLEYVKTSVTSDCFQCQEIASLEAELRSRVQSMADRKHDIHRLDSHLAAVTASLQKVSAVLLCMFMFTVTLF
jgi:hypothetical protein